MIYKHDYHIIYHPNKTTFECILLYLSLWIKDIRHKNILSQFTPVSKLTRRFNKDLLSLEKLMSIFFFIILRIVLSFVFNIKMFHNVRKVYILCYSQCSTNANYIRCVICTSQIFYTQIISYLTFVSLIFIFEISMQIILSILALFYIYFAPHSKKLS